MRTHTAVILVTVLWLTVPSEAAAQERRGFWFGIGGGYGWADASCDDCGDGGRDGSGVAYLKGGWTISEQTLVGAEFNFWSKSAAVEQGVQASLNIYNFSGTVTFYPKADGGFFLKGGAGVAVIDVDVEALGSTLTLDLGTGFGFIVGAGYDIPVGSRVAITPAVNFWYGQPGNLKAMGETLFSSWKQNVIDVTIGITFP